MSRHRSLRAYFTRQLSDELGLEIGDIGGQSHESVLRSAINTLAIYTHDQLQRECTHPGNSTSERARCHVFAMHQRRNPQYRSSQDFWCGKSRAAPRRLATSCSCSKYIFYLHPNIQKLAMLDDRDVFATCFRHPPRKPGHLFSSWRIPAASQ